MPVDLLMNFVPFPEAYSRRIWRIVNISIVLLDMKRKDLMNQEPQPFLLLKQLILLPIFRGSIWAVTRGSHCAGERGSVYAGFRGSICVVFPSLHRFTLKQCKNGQNYYQKKREKYLLLTEPMKIEYKTILGYELYKYKWSAMMQTIYIYKSRGIYFFYYFTRHHYRRMPYT